MEILDAYFGTVGNFFFVVGKNLFPDDLRSKEPLGAVS